MTLAYFIAKLWSALGATVRDLLPIVLVLVLFQLCVLRRPIANWKRVAWGLGAVLLGLTFFLLGLELALFPLGKSMAAQLTAPAFVQSGSGVNTEGVLAASWYCYYWTYLFAFAIGFSATIAEPALLAVATKAEEISGGTLRAWPLRVAVALGSGLGVFLGTLRIVLGIPLPYFILTGYVIIIVQTQFAPRQIVPLAYDSGGVSTSTVTVPLVAALGLGLAANIPGRNPLLEGFVMIALAVLFPMMTVMGYAQLAQWRIKRDRPREKSAISLPVRDIEAIPGKHS
ncbi:MAG: DUF1538 domain-containing protein [Planctomycetaceae bacterium]